MSRGVALGGRVLVEAQGELVRAVHDALRVVEGEPDFHCMCLGDLAIELWASDGTSIALGFHHAKSLRHHTWTSDARLVDGSALPRLLAAHGASSPLRALEAQLEQSRAWDMVRRLWVESAPPGLASDLRRFEGDESGFPHPPGSPIYDEALERLAALYAEEHHAIAALLAWYGGGESRWSGHPAYESLPGVLLLRMGLPKVRPVALAQTHDARIVRGAARLFASYDVRMHHTAEIGEVPETFWARARPLIVALDNADSLARFDAARAASAEVKSRRAGASSLRPGNLLLAGISSRGPLRGLVTDGNCLYSTIGSEVVAFPPGAGGEPRVLTQTPDAYSELSAPAYKMLHLAQINLGTISRVLTDNGRLIVVARDQARPTDPVVGRGLVGWINQAQVPDPERGAPYVVTRSSIVRSTSATPEVLRACPGAAFSLICDEERLYWCESNGGAVELWSADYVRSSPPARLAELSPQSSGPRAWYPKLSVNVCGLYWSDPEARTIHRLDKLHGGAPTTLATLEAAPVAIAVDDYGVFTLTASATGEDGGICYVSLEGGAVRELARYRRPTWDRPAMALDARGVFFTTHDRILHLPRSS
jgi:hypothetical protein